MAGVLFSARNATGVTCVASTADTILQIVAPANQRVKVKSVAVSFNGVTAADSPVLVRLLLQTSAGSGSSAVTPVKTEQSLAETIQTTAIEGPTSEPTGSTVYWGEQIHPQGGAVLGLPPDGLVVKGGERLGVVMTPGATVTGTVLAFATMLCEE